MKDVGDLRAFRTFVTLAAGRTAQEINLSSLGGDAGVSHNTARTWLSILEASFITFLAPAWHRNVRKQIIKAPKLHFVDTGVACSLLGIRDPDQLRSHPLRGALFESWVAGEILKALFNRGRQPDLKHYRESRGIEIDIVLQQAGTLYLVECKSGATTHPSFFKPLSTLQDLIRGASSEPTVAPALVYGGNESHARRTIPVFSWSDIARLCSRIVG